MKTKTKKLTAMQKEWIARVLLVLLFVGLPMLLSAQITLAGEDSGIKAIREKIVGLLCNFLMTAAAIVLVAGVGWHGFKYMSKGKDERGEDSMSELKSGLTRIGIGAAICFGAGMIGKVIANALM